MKSLRGPQGRGNLGSCRCGKSLNAENRSNANSQALSQGAAEKKLNYWKFVIPGEDPESIFTSIFL